MSATGRRRATPRARRVALGVARRLWALSTGRFGIIVVAVVVVTAIVVAVLDAVRPAAGRHRGPLGAAGLAAPARHRRVGPRHPEPASWPAPARRCSSRSAPGIVATVIGISLAALGALTARWVRESVAVFVDILIAFPVLIIAMMISAVWGGSLWVVIWAVGIGFGVNIARVTRPELRRVLQSDFVLAGRASGLTPAQNLVAAPAPQRRAGVHRAAVVGAWRSPCSPRRACRTSASARR